MLAASVNAAFGRAGLMLMLAASVFGYEEPIGINKFIAGAFALGLIFGAYSGEVFRGALKFDADRRVGFVVFSHC